MAEYRTKLLDRDALRQEVAFVCGELSKLGVGELAVSFGWDSDLPIEEMWKEQVVPVACVLAHINRAEQAGTVEIGAADIFIESNEFRFVLCHEGDAHVSGTYALVGNIIQRWSALGYEPRAIKRGA